MSQSNPFATPMGHRRAVAIVSGTVWLVWLVLMITGNRWALFAEGWFMSVTMAFGSFIAGATSEGGGAVAFPVMTLVFHIEPHVARDFSLMIQSIGMTAAGLTIALTRTPVVWRVVAPASVAGGLGMIVGLNEVAPLIPPAIAKLLFTSLWLAFGVTLLLFNRNKGRAALTDVPADVPWSPMLLLAAFLGGIVASITGSGLDICVFSLLVLRYRVSETVATPTSVVLMGINALIGAIWAGQTRGLAPDAWTWWWCCVPVCAIGAPFGAWFISSRTRRFVASVLLVSIAVQYVASLVILPMTPGRYLFSAAIFTGGVLLFGAVSWLGGPPKPADAAPQADR